RRKPLVKGSQRVRRCWLASLVFAFLEGCQHRFTRALGGHYNRAEGSTLLKNIATGQHTQSPDRRVLPQRVLSLPDFAPLLLITKNGGENWNVRVGIFRR